MTNKATPTDAKVWFINGAFRGFGAGLAKAALGAGEKVIATGREMPALDHLGNHETLYSVGMDVTKDTQVKSGIRDGLSLFGTIDVLATMRDSGSSELSKKRPR
jgi:NADP-dependent 3-hydroxy acid dehydrogenase YdfG